MVEVKKISFLGKNAGEIRLHDRERIEFVNLTEDVEIIKEGNQIGSKLITPEDNPVAYFVTVQIWNNGILNISGRV